MTEEQWAWDSCERRGISTLAHILNAFLSFKRELGLERETRMAGARRSCDKGPLVA